MSQRKDKAMRKVAKEMTEELIPKLANNTNAVILSMQQTWPHEDKLQFCRWFLGLDTDEELMAALGEEVEDPNQGILFCDGNHAAITPCADPQCWHKGEDDEIEAESNTSRTQAKGTIQ